jgi:hypothetical protein
VALVALVLFAVVLFAVDIENAKLLRQPRDASRRAPSNPWARTRTEIGAARAGP